MKLEIGDKVKLRSADTGEIRDDVYTILEIDGEFLKLKHSTIGGWFGARSDSVAEVVNECR